MERYRVTYHPLVVKKDIPRLGSAARNVKEATHKKSAVYPEMYGKRLRGVLWGLWKLRVGDWRVVYGIFQGEVKIVGMAHRKEVYQIVKKRLGMN